MLRACVCGTFVGLAGCAGHAVRCDTHLQAINAPLPKPAPQRAAPMDAPNDASTVTTTPLSGAASSP